MCPFRNPVAFFYEGLKVAKRPEAPLQKPLRFVFLGRYEADGLLGETGRCFVGFDVGDESVFVLALCYFVKQLGSVFSLMDAQSSSVKEINELKSLVCDVGVS